MFAVPGAQRAAMSLTVGPATSRVAVRDSQRSGVGRTGNCAGAHHGPIRGGEGRGGVIPATRAATTTRAGAMGTVSRGGASRPRLAGASRSVTRRLVAAPSPLRALGEDGTGSLLDELDADARCPVPKDQRPASQLREVQESMLLGWGGLELKWYCFRLTTLGAFFYYFLAYPIAAFSYNPETQPVEAIICALVGSLTATAAFALLIYNNWSYVRTRLLSATVEYEETGWYDGQVYVKDPEMLARDRLLGTYTVRPIVERLRKTLLACGAGVFVSLTALNSIDAPEYGVERQQYDGGGAGFYMETARQKYEPTTPEEDAEEEENLAAEEASEIARYEAAMARYYSDNRAAAAAAAAATE
mmetsp:Transcript_24157/g.38863  ORF Transcript_24157/g.38863 Transcript_24157/m.38863 type:complete len:359 (-) Transcript_24157:318-1394(-)